jgi:hypothetical protein
MKYGKTTTLLQIACILALAVTLLSGCSGGAQPTPTPELAGSDDTYTSEYLPTSYPAALNASSQLVLGTLQLEDTENAVTSGQAAALLPLWQALRAATLQSEAEIQAVLKQIEGTMTREQLQAIAAMQLTGDDLTSWAQSQGVNLEPRQGFPMLGEDGGLPPEVEERLREQFGGELPNPEERATLQAQRGKMSDEERLALRATAEAGGREFGGGLGQLSIVLNPLIGLLTQRAGA